MAVPPPIPHLLAKALHRSQLLTLQLYAKPRHNTAVASAASALLRRAAAQHFQLQVRAGKLPTLSMLTCIMLWCSHGKVCVLPLAFTIVCSILSVHLACPAFLAC